MSNKQAALNKQAVDSEAAKYWQSYYSESGYGKIWVRDIPKKVAAALLEKTATKTAAKSGKITIQPIATVIDDDKVSLEGIARFAGSKVVKAFVVDFDNDGNVLAFDSSDV